MILIDRDTWDLRQAQWVLIGQLVDAARADAAERGMTAGWFVQALANILEGDVSPW